MADAETYQLTITPTKIWEEHEKGKKALWKVKVQENNYTYGVWPGSLAEKLEEGSAAEVTVREKPMTQGQGKFRDIVAVAERAAIPTRVPSDSPDQQEGWDLDFQERATALDLALRMADVPLAERAEFLDLVEAVFHWLKTGENVLKRSASMAAVIPSPSPKPPTDAAEAQADGQESDPMWLAMQPAPKGVDEFVARANAMGIDNEELQKILTEAAGRPMMPFQIRDFDKAWEVFLKAFRERTAA